jgi:S1-C subfamily serine protease
MNHSLHVLIHMALAAGLGAYALSSPPVAAASDVEPVTATGRPTSPAATPSGGEPTAAAIVSYRAAVARAAPSVVTVHSGRTVSGRLPFTPRVFVKGIASGVIVERDGYIVTNHHAIQGTSDLVVALADGSAYPTRVVGEDPDLDIALLKIDAEGLRPIAVADINDVAVGNPLGIGQTVTQGIVSAIVRRGATPIENFIQTDAAINPGNSGGALVDTAGRLVGINTLILSHSGGSEGIGFAIPVDLVQTVIALLKTKGRVSRAWLGLWTGPPRQGEGARVVAVEREGPADRAGIEPGDVIVRFGERQVQRPQDVTSVVLGGEPSERMTIDLVRNGKPATVAVQLGPLPTQQATP